MISLEEARAKILAAIKPLPAESVALPQAAGRVIAESVTAPFALPSFDNSAMDGYAVRAEDVANATAAAPVPLHLTGRIEAGASSPKALQPGHCARIFTGSVLPPGANAVVMQEDTRHDPQNSDKVLILSRAEPGENVRRCGGDVQAGQQLFAPGDCLSIGALGLLAALGLREVKVARLPKIALLASGSELREPGQPLKPGEIYESNRQMLAPLLVQAGTEPISFPIIPDSLLTTRNSLQAAFAEADAVITTGGVSVGELDFVKPAFEQLGGKLEFWKVAIKPGKPFLFGRWGGKFLFGLPGNPVSALVTFLLLVRPALRRWQGAAETDLPAHPGVLVEKLANPGDRRHFMRVRVDEKGQVRSAGPQASHILSSLAAANGLLDVPPEAIFEPGAQVSVRRWDF